MNRPSLKLDIKYQSIKSLVWGLPVSIALCSVVPSQKNEIVLCLSLVVVISARATLNNEQDPRTNTSLSHDVNRHHKTAGVS